MPDISLTDLVDIAAASGTPKMTKVRQIKRRPPYSPAMDFYRPFRERLIEIHRTGLSRRELVSVLSSSLDQKKQANYQGLIEGYRRWWGRKILDWFDPPSADWSAYGVSVRVNPELGLTINGTPHLIKLYMKSEPLSTNRVAIITHLMGMTLHGICVPNTTMSVLDVRRNNLLTPNVPIPGLTAALEAELAYINALWPNV